MRILLVDDHRMFRDGLKALLAKEADIEVVGEADDGQAALEMTRALEPDLVIMDITMRGLNGVDATHRLLGEHPRSKVIGLSMNADRRYVLAMFEAGAVGYLLKNAASEELVRAIRAVEEGQTYVSPAIAGEVVSVARQGTTGVPQEKLLSPREREVLQLIAEGLTSKEIASRLHLAQATVETHRRQIMDKLGLRSVAALTKYAIREGLTTVDR